MTSEQSSGGTTVVRVTDAELDILVAKGSGGSISLDEVFVLLHGVDPDPDFIAGLRTQLATRGVELEEVEIEAEEIVVDDAPAERTPSAGAAAATARRNARTERAAAKPRSR